jgi:hypothetical protein
MYSHQTTLLLTTLPTLLTAQQLLRASYNQPPAPTAAALFIQQNIFVCPAGQTSCLDGSGGCCKFGVACTSSKGKPVCDEACGIGPKCSGFGCCDVGYTCDYQLTLCTSDTLILSSGGGTGVSASVTATAVSSSIVESKTSAATPSSAPSSTTISETSAAAPSSAPSSTSRSKSLPLASPTSFVKPTLSVPTVVDLEPSSTPSFTPSPASSQGQSTSAPTKSVLTSNAAPTSTVPQSSTVPATVTVTGNGQDRMGLYMSMLLISCGLVFFRMLQ